MVSMTTKSLFSIPLVILGIINLFTMFELMGRPEKRFSAVTLRRTHRMVGLMVFAGTLVLSFLCLAMLHASGGEMTPRSSLHALTAVFLIIILFVKTMIARFYKKLYSLLPSLGLLTFVLLMTTIIFSAGLHWVSGHGADSTLHASLEQKGAVLFQAQCQGCHRVDTRETTIGPGLKGLGKRQRLPVSGSPVTKESLKRQLEQPYRNMPSFKSLTEDEKAALVAYLMGL